MTMKSKRSSIMKTSSLKNLTFFRITHIFQVVSISNQSCLNLLTFQLKIRIFGLKHIIQIKDMAKDKFSTIIQVDAKGQPLFTNPVATKEFFRQFPNQKFAMEVVMIPTDKRSRMIGFYKSNILDSCMKGFRDLGCYYTIEKTDEELCDLSPFTLNKTISDLSEGEVEDHVNFCIKFAAEHLHVVIEGYE